MDPENQRGLGWRRRVVSRLSVDVEQVGSHVRIL
jgi:hypothetical protein